MNIFKIINKEIYISAIIVLFGIICYIILNRALTKILNKSNSSNKLNKKGKTYVKLIRNLLKYILLIVVVITVLQINGINVSSIVAGLGLVSVIAGLALQDALKDVIMGLNIIIDDYFSVGDYLKIGNVEGKVIEVGLKVTKLKDINNGNILVIANRNISEALNLSDQLDLDIPVPYEKRVFEIEEVFEKIINEIEKCENVISCEYKGLNEFESSAIMYKIRIFSKPEFKPQVKREANKIIKNILDDNNIAIPYTQIDVHNIKL